MEKFPSFVEEAQLVYKALKCPHMFSLLPQLLPLQFLDMIHMEEQDVQALERDLEERPWVFGFKQVGDKGREGERELEREREPWFRCNLLCFEKFIKLNMHEIYCNETINIII